MPDSYAQDRFELIEGQSNPPLSPLGEAQSRAVAERLAGEPVAGLFISTLDRTAQTAARVSAAVVITGDRRALSSGDGQ